MKNISAYKNIYFIGIGGIGMSALARYFHAKGFSVSGYDKTPSPLTNKLQEEGIKIHFEDKGNELQNDFPNGEDTLVVYTPAIKKLAELDFFQKNNFDIVKRAQVLGLITNHSLGLGVAGTHGKTTTSTMLAHIMNNASIGCNAFLGGISSNFNTNYLIHPTSKFTVIEADEFDRSFLQLNPYASIITSCDPDHLDIYGNDEQFREGFENYANKINSNGFLILRKGVNLHSNAKTFTYAIDESADFVGENLKYSNSSFFMDVKSSEISWKKIELGLPGKHNAENALACIALCLKIGLSEEEIRNGLKTFKGVKRRFEYQIKKDNMVYIDDYAHHPKEIKALLSAIKLMYPSEKLTVIFQPHLFSRTRDFENDFATELSVSDELILMPIYPAREEPIPNITSENLAAKTTVKSVKVLDANQVIDYIKNEYNQGVLLTVGAGDIDRIVPTLKQILTNK